IGYSLSSPVNYYKADVHDPMLRNGGFLQITGFGRGNCYIHLDPDTITNPPTNHDQMGPPDTYTGARQAVSGGGSLQNFNLLNGCDTSVPGVEDPDAAFPKPSDCVGALPFTPANYPNCLRLHPEFLDQMYLQFNATASAVPTGGSDMAHLSLDAMQMDVAWKGRPSPQFPGGGSVSDPRGAFIFCGAHHLP